MADSVVLTDESGNTRAMPVLSRFVEQIDGKSFGFVIHKSPNLSRFVLVHEATSQRIGILNGGEIGRLGLDEAGKEAFRRFISQHGEIRTGQWLSSLLNVSNRTDCQV